MSKFRVSLKGVPAAVVVAEDNERAVEAYKRHSGIIDTECKFQVEQVDDSELAVNDPVVAVVQRSPLALPSSLHLVDLPKPVAAFVDQVRREASEHIAQLESVIADQREELRHWREKFKTFDADHDALSKEYADAKLENAILREHMQAHGLKPPEGLDVPTSEPANPPDDSPAEPQSEPATEQPTE